MAVRRGAGGNRRPGLHLLLVRGRDRVEHLRHRAGGRVCHPPHGLDWPPGVSPAITDDGH